MKYWQRSPQKEKSFFFSCFQLSQSQALHCLLVCLYICRAPLPISMTHLIAVKQSKETCLISAEQLFCMWKLQHFWWYLKVFTDMDKADILRFAEEFCFRPIPLVMTCNSCWAVICCQIEVGREMNKYSKLVLIGPSYFTFSELCF